MLSWLETGWGQGGDDEGLTRRTKGAKGKGERDEVITAKFDQERGESPFEGDRGVRSLDRVSFVASDIPHLNLTFPRG